MQPLRPAAKVGIVAGALALAFAAAWVAVDVRQRWQNPADVQSASGMYAAGDAMLGVAVFGVLALLPLGASLYWLRPVARFWTGLAGAAVLFALTGPLALVVSGWLRLPAGNWAMLSDLRFALMPLGALAMTTGGLFAPQPKQRWLLIGAGLMEGGLFAATVLVKFVLAPH